MVKILESREVLKVSKSSEIVCEAEGVAIVLPKRP
jgi:hypothetical protein